MNNTRARRVLIAALSALVSGALLLAEAPVTAQNLPTPESVLGFRVGDDFKLATYDESMEYFRALAAASEYVQLVEMGRTSEGRTWSMALISAPANLARAEEYREISRRLAFPDGLSDDEAQALAQRGKAIVHIDGGLHASEVAHAQHTIQLAYDIVANAEDPQVAAILDEVILTLWPSINPDGQNIVVDWYRGNVGGPYEISPVPWLYQKYVGHDNNRDGYMLNMIESRVLARSWRHWEPQIIYVHHQSSPFPTRIWLPPFAEPVAGQVHPLMARTVNAIGMLIARALEERGQVGAVHMGTGFDAWYPGYVDYMPMLRNIAAWWTETALYSYATPGFYTLRDFPAGRRDLRPETLYSSPWPGGWWRLRDAVDYMLTASMATLDYAAKYRRELLYNRYQAGRDTIRKYREGPPYVYWIPADQRDPVAAVEMLRRLAFNGVRVAQVSRDLHYEGIEHAAGSWAIVMDQPMAELVRQLFDVQEYPDLREYPDGPPEQPYDAAGWTLPYQMGVRVVAGTTPLTAADRGALAELSGTGSDWRTALATPADSESDAASFDSVPGLGFDTDEVAAAIVPPSGTVVGSGATLAVDPGENNAFRAVNRTWNAGGTVRFEGDRDGTFLLGGLSATQQESMVADLGLRAVRRASGGSAVSRPRVGLYRPWTASMDEGWTRWVLERYEFDFRSLRDADMRAGGLGARYDVIVLPDIRPGSIVSGHAPGTVPPRYAGGLGDEGVRALAEFVRAGGTLVCLNGSAAFAIEQLGLAIEDVVGELPREEFFAGISILEVEASDHALNAGLPERVAITTSRSPAWRLPEDTDGEVLLRYPAAGSALLSGYLLGADKLHGAAAAVRVPHGAGRVVLLGFRPQWRGQPFGTFRTLFDALLLGAFEAENVVLDR